MNINDSMLKPEQRNSTFLKRSLASYLFWRLHYHVVIDEYEWMDIFGIKRSGYCTEFEIKVSKSDFDNELKNIKSEQPKTTYEKEWTKWKKHAIYLNKQIKDDGTWRIKNVLEPKKKLFIPNEFCFYVPDYLQDYAIEQLQGLPYGVVAIGGHKVEHFDGTSHMYFHEYNVIKKPKKLHEDKVEESMFSKLAYSLTNRIKLLN